MKVDIGRVFSNTWEMVKQRFWLLLGMIAVYFAVQMVFGIVFGGVFGGALAAMGASAGSFDDPSMMLGGLGIGMIIFLLLFYVAIFLITFAQQCSMSALASPLQNIRFGDAIGIGFKGGLTFLGIIGLLIVAYIAFAIVGAIVGFVLSFLGEAAAILIALLFFPAIIYLGLRFAVVVPVVAVDREFNPIKALQRTWQMTSGNVLAILVVFIVVTIAAMVLMGIPFFLMFGSLAALGASGDPSAAMGAVGAFVGIMLLLVPLFLIYSIVSVTVTACLHAEMSDTGTQNLEETFG